MEEKGEKGGECGGWGSGGREEGERNSGKRWIFYGHSSLLTEYFHGSMPVDRTSSNFAGDAVLD